MIAAVGVYAVFKMAFFIAGETGRGMNAARAAQESPAAPSEAAGGVKAASALEPSLLHVHWRVQAPPWGLASALGVGAARTASYLADRQNSA